MTALVDTAALLETPGCFLIWVWQRLERSAYRLVSGAVASGRSPGC